MQMFRKREYWLYKILFYKPFIYTCIKYHEIHMIIFWDYTKLQCDQGKGAIFLSLKFVVYV